MCLNMLRYKNDRQSLIEALKRRLKKNPYMWKIVYLRVDGSVTSQWGNMFNIPFGKWLISNRKNRNFTLELSYRELSLMRVNQGFHVYTTRKAARSRAAGQERVIKVKVDPKTLIAVGRSNSRGDYGDSAVFHKILYPHNQKPKR